MLKNEIGTFHWHHDMQFLRVGDEPLQAHVVIKLEEPLNPLLRELFSPMGLLCYSVAPPPDTRIIPAIIDGMVREGKVLSTQELDSYQERANKVLYKLLPTWMSESLQQLQKRAQQPALVIRTDLLHCLEYLYLQDRSELNPDMALEHFAWWLEEIRASTV